MTSYVLRRPWTALPEIGPNGLVHHAEMSAAGISRCLFDCPACYGYTPFPLAGNDTTSPIEPTP